MNRRDLRPRVRMDPQERREAILAAARREFGERGWTGAAMATIGNSSGSSEALIYKYFSGKDGLYLELVEESIDGLRAARTAAIEALPDGIWTRERIKAVVVAHLDFAAARRGAWAQPLLDLGNEPPQISSVRAQAREQFVAELRQWLPQHNLRHTLAADGFPGFLDAVCRSWVVRGCPPEDQPVLVEVALGSLEGALGDWVT